MIGISYREMTLHEIITSFNGICKHRTSEMKQLYDAARLQAFYTVLMAQGLKKEDKPEKPTDLILFPWENEVQKKYRKPTEDEWKEIDKIFPDKI